MMNNVYNFEDFLNEGNRNLGGYINIILNLFKSNFGSQENLEEFISRIESGYFDDFIIQEINKRSKKIDITNPTVDGDFYYEDVIRGLISYHILKSKLQYSDSE